MQACTCPIIIKSLKVREGALMDWWRQSNDWAFSIQGLPKVCPATDSFIS